MPGPSRLGPALATLIVAAGLGALVCSPAAAEVSQKGGMRVSVRGKLAPATLPRSGTAPVTVSFAGQISSKVAVAPPQLQQISIAINAHGHLQSQGLPLCRLGHIDPSTTQEALAACRSSLIGEGSFSADVRLPEQSPFPSLGKVLAFNGRLRGQPVIFAHIYGTAPVPTSYVLPFAIKAAQGTYGTILEASFPQVTGDWGFVTGISMTLGRNFSFHGHRTSYLSAGCPAPKGFHGVVFPLARTSFSFAGGLKLNSVLNRSCKVKG